MSKMKILEAAIVTKLKFVTLFSVSYLDRKNKARDWHMVSRCETPKCVTGKIHQPDATIIVPYHREEQKLVVIKEFRVPVGDYMVGFPAGLIDPGEDIAITAGRELYEETGLELVNVYRHSPAVFSSAGITDEAISMVFVEVTGTPSIRNTSDSEDIAIFLMDRGEIRELLTRHDIVFGARAWLAMDAYVRMGSRYFAAE
jgi:ADP-ribose pyrophosphatase